MKLYNQESCPFCELVRDKLDELSLTCEITEVPGPRQLRKEVFEVSGQYLVPVLVDGDIVLDDEDKIVKYLEETYGKNKKERIA